MSMRLTTLRELDVWVRQMLTCKISIKFSNHVKIVNYEAIA